MEFLCRVATASGQVSETTFVAESEARLRMELEERGLYLLSVQRRGGPVLVMRPDTARPTKGKAQPCHHTARPPPGRTPPP